MAHEDDYRSFLFAIHKDHGMLLLHCTRKKKKGPHYQVPGGHVDKEDFEAATTTATTVTTGTVDATENNIIQENNNNENENGPTSHIIHACKIGVARELYEETGMDIRKSLDRIMPVRLRGLTTLPGSNELFCEWKKRMFFSVHVSDDDFLTKNEEAKIAQRLSKSMNNIPPHLMLKLSHEHQGFVFEPDPEKSVELLLKHSGGKVSTALRMAMEQGEIKRLEPYTTTKTTNGTTGRAVENIAEKSKEIHQVEVSSERKRTWHNIFNWCDC